MPHPQSQSATVGHRRWCGSRLAGSGASAARLDASIPNVDMYVCMNRGSQREREEERETDGQRETARATETETEKGMRARERYNV